MTNDDLEARVVASLPASYGGLCASIGVEFDRKIDAALQRLKKKGAITFVRNGRVTTWMRVDAVDNVSDPLRHAFRNADEKDWDHLFRMLPASGHGQFWKAVMLEAKAALAAKHD